MLVVNVKRIKIRTAVKHGFKQGEKPLFEPVWYAKRGSGFKIFYGHFSESDVKNASPKFQEIFKNYQSTVFDTNTSRLNGPSWEMFFGLRKLLKQAKKENVKLYSDKELDQIFDDFQKKEDKRLDEWLANHPQVAEEVEKNIDNPFQVNDVEDMDDIKNNDVQSDDKLKIDDIYEKVMEEAGLEK